MATAPSANDLTRQQLDELDALLQRMLSLPINPADAPPPAPPPAPLPTPVAPAPRPEPVAAVPTPSPARSGSWRVDAPAPAPAPAPYLLADPVGDPEPAIPFVPPAALVPVPTPTAPAASPPPPPPPPARAPEVPPTDEIVVEVAPAWTDPELTALSASHLPFADPEPEPEREYAPPRPAPVAVAPVPAPAAAPAAATPPAPVPPDDGVLGAVDRAIGGALGLLGPVGRVLRSGVVKNVLGFAGIGLLVYTAAHVAQVQGLVTLPVPLPWPAR